MADAAPATQDLRRQLGWLDAAALFVGIILGSGIFAAPADVAAATSSPVYASLLWIVGAIIAGCGACCYAECGARLPQTGGFYVFYRKVYGEPVAFIGGWAALLVTYPSSLAAIAQVCARYFAQVVPAAKSHPTFATAAMLGAAVLNVVGVQVGAWAQRLLTFTKVAALAALCLAALFAPSSAAPVAVATPVSAFTVTALLGAMVGLLWTYDGWSDVTMVAGELKDPGRNLGRAVLTGTLVLAALYILVQTAVMTLLSPEQAASSKQVVSDAVGVTFGSATGRVVALLVVVCTFGSLTGVVFSSSRLAYAMARDGVMVRWLGVVDPRFGTPLRAVLGIVGVTLVYVWSTSFQNLLTLFSFNVWIFYGLTAVALLILRRRGVGEPPSWRAPGGPIAPIVLLLTALGMTMSLLQQDPKRTLLGSLLLVAAAPVYLVWRRLRPQT